MADVLDHCGLNQLVPHFFTSKIVHMNSQR